MSGLRTRAYVGETKRTLKRCIVERKQAVKRFDQKNGVVVHANTHDHHTNWEERGQGGNSGAVFLEEQSTRGYRDQNTGQFHEFRLWVVPQ